MGFLDLFRSPPPVAHPSFGRLQYARGRWRGGVVLDGRRLLLVVPGGRAGPSADALDLAERAPSWWAAVRPEVEAAVYEHYEAGREAGIEGIPQLATAGEIWPHVSLSSVQIDPYGVHGDVEIALRVVWDEEHTLGVLVRDGRFAGLNGSILEPR